MSSYTCFICHVAFECSSGKACLLRIPFLFSIGYSRVYCKPSLGAIYDGSCPTFWERYWVGYWLQGILTYNTAKCYIASEKPWNSLKFSDIKGWNWIENSGKDLPSNLEGKLERSSFTLKCQVMQSWKVLVCEIPGGGKCCWLGGEKVSVNSLCQLLRTFLSLSQKTLLKVIESPVMGPLVKFSWVHLYGACKINHQFWGKWCNSVTLWYWHRSDLSSATAT